MSWYKQAIINSEEDRTQMNAVCKKLKTLAEALTYAGQLVYMTGRGARRMASEVAENKTVTSFPIVQKILTLADRVALDSPDKFKSLCREASDHLMQAAAEIEDERHEFVEKTLPRQKGLVDE